MLKRTTYKKPDTTPRIVLNLHYSLSEEKYSKEKAIAELDAQLDLATKLLLKATDVEQRYKLEAKKKNCLEKKEALLKVINEIKNVYIFFHKGQLIYEFVEELYNFYVKLFNTDCDVDPIFLKKLEILQNKEKKLIKLTDCRLVLKDVIGESYSECTNLEKNIENFFYKVENEPKAAYPNSFISYILFCEKIFELFKELVKGETRFDLNKLRDFFQRQFANFSIPSVNHTLVGIAAILIYKTLFNFLKRQPIDSNFKTLGVYIKFHIDISSFSTENIILHEVSIVKKKTNILKYKFKDFIEVKSKLSKCAIDKYLKLIEVRQQELNSIKLHLKIFFENKYHMQSLKLLNTILKKEADELICFMKNRTGLDVYFVTDKQAIYTMQSKKMFIKYFFSCIYKPSTAESLRKAVEHFATMFETAVECISIDLLALTNKDLLTLSYLSYFMFIFFELHIELERLENKLIQIKLSLLDISLNLSLDKLNIDSKNLEDKEKAFFEKKFFNKNNFYEGKKNLLDEFEFFLGFIKCAILQSEEIYSLQSKFSYACTLNNLNITGENFFSTLFNLGDEHVKKTSYLIDMNNKFSVKQEAIKKYLLSETFTQTKITNTKKTSLERQEVEVVKSLNFESLFVPIARIAKDLYIVAEFIEQPEMVIIKCNKDFRKKNKFPSAIGRIRASTNLVIQVFYECNNRLLNSNLLNSLEAIQQAIRKTVFADNDENLNLFKKNVDSCFLFVDRINKVIITVTNQCELHNSEIEKFLENDGLESPMMPSNFFRCASVSKKINITFKNEYYTLSQKIGWLKTVISIIGNTETSVSKKFYSMVYQAEEYEKIFHCIQQQNEALTVCSHSFSDFPVTADKNMQAVVPKNYKLTSKNKKKRLQRKKNNTCTENYFLEKDDCRLLELRKFKEWSAELESWKQKRYFHLDSVFNTIENCSFANLNKTATAFFKILDYYTKELLDKHQELKVQLSQLSIYQDFLGCVEPIKKFMLYSDQWFCNVLARLKVCKHYMLQSSKTYNTIIGNNSAVNAGSIPCFPVSQAINSLFAEYLNYFIIYSKNNSRLLFEEKQLAAINEEFIVNILKKDSLAGIEQEANLLFQFNEKLCEVNHLNSVVNEAQEKKQKVKEELARIVEPEALNFYLKRIDPADTQIFRNSSPLSIGLNYTFTPSSSNFFAYDSPDLNVNNVDYKFDMEYRAQLA